MREIIQVADHESPKHTEYTANYMTNRHKQNLETDKTVLTISVEVSTVDGQSCQRSTTPLPGCSARKHGTNCHCHGRKAAWESNGDEMNDCVIVQKNAEGEEWT